MHPCNAVTFAQLLSVRDGEPVDAGAQRHVEHCDLCTRELARLNAVRDSLRALPELGAPSYDPAALRGRARPALTKRLSIAAGVATVGAVATLAIVTLNNPRESVSTADTHSPPSVVQSADEPTLDSLVIRSQDLESRLRRLPPRPRVERASTSATIDSLQGRIQWVDYQLSLAREAGMTDRQTESLWEDRVRLMDSLVMVRYAEAQRTAYLVPVSGSSL